MAAILLIDFDVAKHRSVNEIQSNTPLKQPNQEQPERSNNVVSIRDDRCKKSKIKNQIYILVKNDDNGTTQRDWRAHMHKHHHLNETNKK